MPGAPIVLFFLDQLRADAIGAAGNAYVRTPNLDALAAKSVRFETCITNAPLCRPARICLLSGQPVGVHRFDDNQHVPRPGSLPSHVAELSSAGYHTTVVGKTHLHAGIGHLDHHKPALEAWGYRQIVELPDAQMHQLRSAHSDWLTTTTRPGDLDKHVRWKDFVANHRPTSDPPDAAPWHLDTEDQLDSFCARRAAEIVRAPSDRPLYLQVCFPGPHPPFDPTTEYLPDAQRPIPPPISGPRRGPVAPTELRYRRAQRRWTADDIALSRRAYFGKVALVDHGIGRVLAALEETQLDEQAWIIVTADHGELLGDHGFHGKVLPFESSIRIPLLIRPPGGTTARVDRGVTELLDVVATVRAIAGLDAGPWGGSLVDRVLGSSSSPASPGVVFGNLGYVGLRTAELTMTWDARTGDALELFDRTVDPHQLENRVDDPRYRDPICDGWAAVVRERARPPAPERVRHRPST